MLSKDAILVVATFLSVNDVIRLRICREWKRIIDEIIVVIKPDGKIYWRAFGVIQCLSSCEKNHSLDIAVPLRDTRLRIGSFVKSPLIYVYGSFMVGGLRKRELCKIIKNGKEYVFVRLRLTGSRRKEWPFPSDRVHFSIKGFAESCFATPRKECPLI